MELVDAATTVADVNFRLTLYSVPLNVILQNRRTNPTAIRSQIPPSAPEEINRSMNPK
jgi:hypothetical protein